MQPALHCQLAINMNHSLDPPPPHLQTSQQFVFTSEPLKGLHMIFSEVESAILEGWGGVLWGRFQTLDRGGGGGGYTRAQLWVGCVWMYGGWKWPSGGKLTRETDWIRDSKMLFLLSGERAGCEIASLAPCLARALLRALLSSIISLC